MMGHATAADMSVLQIIVATNRRGCANDNVSMAKKSVWCIASIVTV